MSPLLTLILAAITVKSPTPLRTGCSEDTDTVAQMAAGTPVDIRFAFSGEAAPCYKVAAQVEGREVLGYVAASALSGLEEFDKSRRQGSWLDLTQALAAPRPAPAASLGFRGSPDLAQASELVRSSQPARALEMLEPELRKRTDPNAFALAGMAAWRADDPKRALEYWKTSLELQPNPDLERFYRKVEKETQGDQSAEKLYGLRVVLRYEGATMPADLARSMVALLDDEFSRVSAHLGCTAQERIVAIAQSPQAYRKTTDAAEWSAGQFDGRIRIALLEGSTIGPQTRRALVHESVHACLSMLGQWPAWLHEGLAQRLSGDAPAPDARRRLADRARTGALPRLANLRQDWSRMSGEHAWAAYQLSLLAMEIFFDAYSQYGIRNLLSNPDQLPRITADLDRRLGL